MAKHPKRKQKIANSLGRIASRQAVESAIQASKGTGKRTWEESAQRAPSVPTWHQTSKREAAQQSN